MSESLLGGRIHTPPTTEETISCAVRPRKDRPVEETTVEQTEDGAFRRQRNAFTARFGTKPGEVKPEFGRYHVLGAIGCGWNRRQRKVIRLLGLDKAFPVEVIYGRDRDGWKLRNTPGSVGEKFGFTRLNEFYGLTDPTYSARGTSPSVIDAETGHVVTNNYHLLSLDLETAWKPFQKADAPDLYPANLRGEIDLLNQQIFDDVNNGTYKILFATNVRAAEAAYTVFKARLTDYDFRLASRRYLFGPQLTDSDVRLFQTLESFEHSYRPGIVETFGTEDIIHVWDFPNVWAYARDLFQTPGFIDDEELYGLGYIPDEEGKYISQDLVSHASVKDSAARRDEYQRWLEPSGRESLGGSPYYSGPGGGGSYELWDFGRSVDPYRG